MHLIARVRGWLVRHPLLYWSGVAAVAGAAALLVASLADGVTARQRAWGESRQLWVASTDISPGDALAVESRTIPRALAPATAVIDNPHGAISRQHLSPGEIVTAADVGGTGPHALAPTGSVALALPTSGAKWNEGDAVVVFDGSQRVAAGVVIQHSDDSVLVAVDAADAGAVSQAVLDGTAVVGLAG